MILRATAKPLHPRFRRNEPGYDYDWHLAPQRQFIMLLDGVIEIEVSDGERQTFRRGDILLNR